MRNAPCALMLLILLSFTIEGCAERPHGYYHRYAGGAGEHRDPLTHEIID